jgi:ABC-type multidrug transport system ATPase subunit
VKEALTFAARLRLTIPKADQDRKVIEVMGQLGLSACANTPIGSAKRKSLSGGERKRCAIGVEIVTDPSLLILDEPTSGLDSFKAY